VKFLFLFLSLLGAVAFAENDAPKFNFYVPTDRMNPAKGRYDALRLQFEDVEAGEMGGILKQSKAVLPKFAPGQVPTIPFYVSRQRSEAEQVAMAEEIRKQFKQAYPDVEPKVQIHYLEKEEVDVEALSKRLNQHLDAIEEKLPKDEQSKALVEALRAANAKALKETLDSLKVREPLLERNSVVTKIIQGVAGARALFTFASRGAQMYEAGNQGAVPMLAGVAMVAGGPANDYFTLRFEREVDYLLNDHPLFPKALRQGWRERVSDVYQHNEWAKLIKGSLGTAAIWGVLDPISMQALGHVNNPGYIPPVSGEAWIENALTSIPSAFMANGGFIGMDKLRQQGRLKEAHMDLVLRGVGLLWQIAEVFMSTGRPEFKAMVPATLAPIYLSMGAAIVAPLVLPPKNDRFVVVDTALTNHEDIVRKEILESTQKVESKSDAIQSKVKEVEDMKPIEVPKLGRFLGKIGVKCMEVLAMAANSRATPTREGN